MRRLRLSAISVRIRRIGGKPFVRRNRRKPGKQRLLSQPVGMMILHRLSRRKRRMMGCGRLNRRRLKRKLLSELYPLKRMIGRIRGPKKLSHGELGILKQREPSKMKRELIRKLKTMRVQSQQFLDSVNNARRQREAQESQQNAQTNRTRSAEVEQAQQRHADNVRRIQESQAASQQRELKLAQE